MHSIPLRESVQESVVSLRIVLFNSTDSIFQETPEDDVMIAFSQAWNIAANIPRLLRQSKDWNILNGVIE